MKIGVCGNSTIQHKYKNCYFFRKSSGIMYLALAVAPATWYNTVKTIIRPDCYRGICRKKRDRNQKLPDCLPLRMVQKDENCYAFSEEKSGVRIWKLGNVCSS